MRPAILLAVLLSLVPFKNAAFAQLTGAPPQQLPGTVPQQPPGGAPQQLVDTGNFRIGWEVKNRFRLFRREADFLRQVAASRGDGVLAAEQRLERDRDGLGWAKDVVANLCVDTSGNLMTTCERDGTKENYVAPADHRISVELSGNVPQGATCTWTFDDGQGALRQNEAPCEGEVILRVASTRTTVASVDIPLGDGTAQRVVTEIYVRDVLIAGLGDSIAAGVDGPFSQERSSL